MRKGRHIQNSPPTVPLVIYDGVVKLTPQKVRKYWTQISSILCNMQADIYISLINGILEKIVLRMLDINKVAYK